MLKRITLSLALAATPGAVLAADLRGPIIEAPPPLPVPGFSWTGGYVGVNVGVGSATPNYSYDVASGGSSGTNYYDCANPTQDDNGVHCSSDYFSPGYSNSGSEHVRSGGVLGGVQIGYNYAIAGGFGGFGGGLLGRGIGITPVIGVEADFDGTGIGSNATLGQFASGSITGTPTDVKVGSSLDYFGTVRGRLGVAFDRLLVYGTGGFAYGQVESYVSSPTNGIYDHKSNFHTGYVYGGGVQYAITNNLLFRAEYLHLDLDRKSIAGGSTYDACGCVGTSYGIREKPSLDLVRAGLDYKFDFARAVAPPVIARY